jgi:hypothetical protein
MLPGGGDTETAPWAATPCGSDASRRSDASHLSDNARLSSDGCPTMCPAYNPCADDAEAVVGAVDEACVWLHGYVPEDALLAAVEQGHGDDLWNVVGSGVCSSLALVMTADALLGPAERGHVDDVRNFMQMLQCCTDMSGARSAGRPRADQLPFRVGAWVRAVCSCVAEEGNVLALQTLVGGGCVKYMDDNTLFAAAKGGSKECVRSGAPFKVGEPISCLE